MNPTGFQDHLRHVEGLELLHEAARVPPGPDAARCTLAGRDGTGQAMTLKLDDTLFSKHLLFLGNIGTGKTNAISQFVSQIKEQLTADDLLIIFDTKGDFHQAFYKPGDVVISNNGADFQGAAEPWNIFKEVLLDGSGEGMKEIAQEVAHNLFADQIKRTSQPFFPQAAKDILGTFLTVCATRIADDQLTNDRLMGFFEGQTRDDIRAFFEKHGEARIGSYLSKEAAAQADGVLAELNQLLGQLFVGDFRKAGGLSVRELVRQKGGRTIFIEYDITLGSVLAPIYRLLLDLAIKEAMGKKRGKGNVWVFIDEFRLIPNLQHIDNGINFGRSQGLKFILGIQNIPQVHNEYGEALAESLLSGLSTTVSFRVDDSRTREFVQNRYGFALKKLVHKKLGQVGPNQIQEEVRPSKVVEDWDISRLPVGSAIIGLPGQDPFIFRFGEWRGV